MEKAGKACHESRSLIMLKANEGLTTTYNRFHDPNEPESSIESLRELHRKMDQAVLRAYGWNDLAETARCGFFLAYEVEEDDFEVRKSKRKKPWRLRWPDEFRDEVLARLLELNEQRYREVQLAGSRNDCPRHQSNRQVSRGTQGGFATEVTGFPAAIGKPALTFGKPARPLRSPSLAAGGGSLSANRSSAKQELALMAQSSIEWTDSTWNPVTGCTKISEGCRFCYAERMSRRLLAMGQPNYANGFKLTLQEALLDRPLSWKKPRLIFVNSMSDLFHKDVPLEFIQRVWGSASRTGE